MVASPGGISGLLESTSGPTGNLTFDQAQMVNGNLRVVQSTAIFNPCNNTDRRRIYDISIIMSAFPSSIHRHQQR
jgi:hypothetical protein